MGREEGGREERWMEREGWRKRREGWRQRINSLPLCPIIWPIRNLLKIKFGGRGSRKKSVLLTLLWTLCPQIFGGKGLVDPLPPKRRPY